MLKGGIVAILTDFLNFLLQSVYNVPLEISVGSATFLTFIFVVNEIFGRLSLWRVVLITIWGMVLLNFFIPLEGVGKDQVWLVIGVIGFVTGMIEWRLHDVIQKKNMRKCPNCGHEAGLIEFKKVKRSRQWLRFKGRNQSPKD